MIEQLIDEIIKQNYLNKDNKPDYTKQNETLKDTVKQYSQSDFRNDVTDEEMFKNIAGRKWKKNIKILISFIDEYKYIFSRDTYYSKPISVTNKNLLNIFDNSRNISNVLKLAQEVDLLKCVDDFYQFNAINEVFNCCKKYIYNKVVQDLIIKLANKYKIVGEHFKNSKRTNKAVAPKNVKIKISSKLRLPDMTDDEVYAGLDKTYKQFYDYQLKADKINEGLPAGDPRRIRFVPTINRSKGKSTTITSIGLRATNSLVSLKEHDNGNETGRMWRKDWLKEHFGETLNYDVTSSIFRTNYFLSCADEWPDDTIDYYSLMAQKTFKNKEERKMFKAMAMPLYFERSTGTLYTHVTNKAMCLKKHDQENLKVAFDEMRNRMFNVIGSSMDSEIFLHESCIYMDLHLELKSKGYEILQVYDGFYVKKPENVTQEMFTKECQDILKQVAKTYKQTYFDK